MSYEGPTSPPPPPGGGYGSPPPSGPGGPYGGGGYGAGGFGSPGGTPPPNYLVWAIVTTVLCCLPLGIASIVFSSQVNSKWAMGDAAGAMDSSQKAKKFAVWSAIAGPVFFILYLLLFGGLAALSGGTGT